MNDRPPLSAPSAQPPNGIQAELYRKIASHLPGGAVFVVDHALVYLLADGEALGEVGMVPADLEGKTVRQVMGIEMADQAETDYRLVLEGHSFEREHAVHDQFYLSRGTPLKSHDSTVRAALVISYNITRRVQAEKALREADQQKDRFLAMLVHEMRGPLMPLLTGVELLKLKDRGSKTATVPHAMMERQVRHLMRLVEDLSDQGRMRLGKLHLEHQSVYLRDILSQAVEAVSLLIEQKDHVLVNRVQNESMQIQADPARLVQVFTNLIQNAAKYSPPCSTIELTAQQLDSEIQVEIKDNGNGIPPEKLQSVFNLFTQLSTSSASAVEGLGIGLALVKGLVEAHGGQVTAYSEGPGLGSCFTVKLPMSAKLPLDGMM